MPILKANIADFILLNHDIKLQSGKIINYINATGNLNRYKSGLHLFKNFGLISATTTLSCLVFKRKSFSIKTFSIKTFEQYCAKSQVYSHSFSLLHMFKSKPCAFLCSPVLTYTQNSMEQESANFSEIYPVFFYPQTIGLAKLIKMLSIEAHLTIDTILGFEEIEMSKTEWIIVKNKLGCFFLQYSKIHLIEWFLNPSVFSKKVAKDLLESVLLIISSSHDVNEQFKELILTIYEQFTQNSTLCHLEREKIAGKLSYIDMI